MKQYTGQQNKKNICCQQSKIGFGGFQGRRIQIWDQFMQNGSSFRATVMHLYPRNTKLTLLIEQWILNKIHKNLFLFSECTVDVCLWAFIKVYRVLNRIK